MKAYKGFTSELKSIKGNNDQEQCTFRVGETKITERSKTVRTGFHCCENPTGCLSYYPWEDNNRFFIVEATGSIDEDAEGRIACTEITLVKEMDTWDFVYQTMLYMIDHPQRTDWEKRSGRFVVARDKAMINEKTEKHRLKTVLIARGEDPTVNGPEGAVAGFLVEKRGEIVDAKVCVIEANQAGKDLHLKSGEVTV